MDKEELISTLDKCVEEIIKTIEENDNEVTRERVLEFYAESDYFQNIYGPAGDYVMSKILSKKDKSKTDYFSHKKQDNDNEIEGVISKGKTYPDLLVTWNPKVITEVEYSVEVWNPKRRCDICDKVGSYVLRDDENSTGVCRRHIEEEVNTTKKTVVKIEELPDNHDY